MKERRGSFVEQVLDGHARIDQLEQRVEQWMRGERRRALHEVLGLDADELELIARWPKALRYIIHARRFNLPLELDELRGPTRISAYSARLAADVIDPFQLAQIESWSESFAADGSSDREPTHA